MPLIQCVASKASSRTPMSSDFCITKMSVRFKSLTAVLLMAALFWDVTPCCWVSSWWRRHRVSQSDCVFHGKKSYCSCFWWCDCCLCKINPLLTDTVRCGWPHCVKSHTVSKIFWGVLLDCASILMYYQQMATVCSSLIPPPPRGILYLAK
jgi:hypothetical protein